VGADGAGARGSEAARAPTRIELMALGDRRQRRIQRADFCRPDRPATGGAEGAAARAEFDAPTGSPCVCE